MTATLSTEKGSSSDASELAHLSVKPDEEGERDHFDAVEQAQPAGRRVSARRRVQTTRALEADAPTPRQSRASPSFTLELAATTRKRDTPPASASSAIAAPSPASNTTGVASRTRGQRKLTIENSGEIEKAGLSAVGGDKRQDSSPSTLSSAPSSDAEPDQPPPVRFHGAKTVTPATTFSRPVAEKGASPKADALPEDTTSNQQGPSRTKLEGHKRPVPASQRQQSAKRKRIRTALTCEDWFEVIVDDDPFASVWVTTALARPVLSSPHTLPCFATERCTPGSFVRPLASFRFPLPRPAERHSIEDVVVWVDSLERPFAGPHGATEREMIEQEELAERDTTAGGRRHWVLAVKGEKAKWSLE